MRFCSLISGSRANCTFLEAGSVRLLIDCGLSATQAEAKLRLIGIDPRSIDAILVTHEHRDHIAGIPVWSRRFPKTAIYANKKTGKCLEGVAGKKDFSTGEYFELAALKVLPFPVSHDATEPCGFRFEADGAVFSYATDLGEITPAVEQGMRGSQAVFIESNHDIEMLKGCRYPADLKARILSAHGHLSNNDCGRFITEIFHDELINVILGHLSENSNTPDLALNTVLGIIPEKLHKTVICASRYTHGPVITVGERAAFCPSEVPQTQETIL